MAPDDSWLPVQADLAVYSRLVGSKIEEDTLHGTFLGTTTEYVPNSTINFIATQRNIRKVLNNEPSASGLSKLQKKNCATRVHRIAKRVFIICVVHQIPMSFLLDLNHVDNELKIPLTFTDEMLPFGNQDVGMVPGQFTKSSLDNFIPYQPYVCSPTFRLGSFDQTFSSSDILPMKTGSSLGHGAAGDVTIVQVDKSHLFYPGSNPTTDQWSREFAMKSFKQPYLAQREMNFIQALREAGISSNHAHLATSYGGFTCAGNSYLISEKADTNLDDYMKQTSSPPPSPSTRIWLKRQFLGLADALRAIHDLKPDVQAGYIHDIKPDNVLVFYTANNPRFKWTDWGCAKVNDIKEGTSHQSRTRGAPPYNPPESINGIFSTVTSRPHDIWSLGCMYLELLVWITEGWTSLNAFRGALGGDYNDDNNEYRHDDFHHDDKIKPEVVSKLVSVRSAQGGTWNGVCTEIDRMLRITPSQRPRAANVVDALKQA
ncbi:kinase-like protein [Clathrospora elynae]|uniref:Kinase-like protein n=1 Tax=Clathrospora elynae TaxID=706981 RepID=A0A6A5SMM4_9PLEO|nr:kinase-like protein [Clathrospora elynae]